MTYPVTVQERQIMAILTKRTVGLVEGAALSAASSQGPTYPEQEHQ